MLSGEEQVHQSFEVHDNLVGAKLALPVNAIHEHDGDLPDLHPRLVRTDKYLHLEGVAFGLDPRQYHLDGRPLVQPEGPGKVRRPPGRQEEGR